MDRTEILTSYATDMNAVEAHILEAVERQISSDETQKYPDAVRVLTSLKNALQSHTQELERYNESTEGGGVKEAVKEAVFEALGIAAGFYDLLRPNDTVSRMIRDTYTATGLAAISYHMLYTTALGLKDQRLATIAINNLKDLTKLIGELSEVVCTVVAAELTAEDKMIDASVGQQAVEATQKAWRPAGE